MTTLRLRQGELAWREIDGELVAVDLPASTYLGGNPSAVVLWRLLAEGTTREQLVEALVTTFGVDAERAEADVDAFLEQLSARSLLED